MIGSITRLALNAIDSVTIAENGIRIRGNDMFRTIDPRLSTDCIEVTDPTMTSWNGTIAQTRTSPVASLPFCSTTAIKTR